MSNFRNNMISKARQIVNGEIVGDKVAAGIALHVVDIEKTIALFTGVELTDAELNTQIVAAITNHKIDTTPRNAA